MTVQKSGSTPHHSKKILEIFKTPKVYEVSQQQTVEARLLDGQALRKEFWSFLVYALPPTVSYALDTGVEIVCLAFVAKLGERELAAAGLAFMLSNMSGHAVYTGASTALGTLGSQAYGARKYELVGLLLQQAMVVAGVVLAAISTLWLFAGQMFHACGIAPTIAGMAGSFIRWQILTLPPMALMQLLKVWLEAQGILRPITAVSCAVLVFTWMFGWLLIERDMLGLGLYGAPVAVLCAYTCGNVVFLGLIAAGGYQKKTWKGWSWGAKAGLWGFAGLALTGAGMVCLEWWSYEVLGVVGSAFGETATAVQTVLVNFSYFMYATGEGIAIAAGTRVGNALGAGLPVAAQRSAGMAVFLALLSAFFIIVPLWASRGTWVTSFLQGEESFVLVSRCTPALMLFLLFNSGYGALSGILLGSGKQQVGLVANLVACYLIGIPLGLTMSFYYGHGILGLWWGQVWGVFLLFTSLSIYIMSIDWRSLAMKTRAELESDGVEMSEGLLEGGFVIEDS
ncbi:hypothetical protein GUITHDRAFT_93333 [Guillardia theta CCMP2712]|uniref:Multidrug and toxic compound extrusion protein n=2 Tax=Guillardia theta TaxID=55529 RepID=L1JMA8_GUITC|nr:hypothetical protein GUITHDRAFT_93333 [Guillardia theta CCMP2712]EKX49295.1 hypothetical protein GUITHDRAFT_93333 [Guillardia theta CCMP2712]|mmetsp:Transcript_28521/g.92037  ORF Transcript_28521/g.92037 Transcript_28521/m.92037 type:complete len:510 (+) Transcript_28521:115-1644(+)|eukprot:XP_005836275.1 hypothetical protein GUITHDRAFT_93333 [Guillardia theta CCMP2712]